MAHVRGQVKCTLNKSVNDGQPLSHGNEKKMIQGMSSATTRGKEETMRRTQVMKILEEASKERETGHCVSSPRDKLKNEDSAAQLELQGSTGSQNEEGRGHGEEKGNGERAMRWKLTVMFKGALPVSAFEP